MNLNKNPTIEQLRQLIKQGDDSTGHHVLWVKQTGDVELSSIPVNRSALAFERDHPDMKLRFEPFLAGNEYVGPEAAGDADWMAELFEALVREWQKARANGQVACVVDLDAKSAC